MLESEILFAIIGHLCPVILTFVSLKFSIDFAAIDGNPDRQASIYDRPATFDLAFFNLLLNIAYRTSARTLYGYGVSKFYYFLRRPIYDRLSIWCGNRTGIDISPSTARILRFLLIESPFYVPLITSLVVTREVSAAVIRTIFAPILAVEIFYTVFVFTHSYVTISLAFARILAPLDLMRLQIFVKLLWGRLRVPQVFRTFFCVRMAVHLVYVVYVALILGPVQDPYGVFAKRQITSNWLWTGGVQNGTSDPTSESNRGVLGMGVAALEYLLARSCETVPAIMASTSIVALIGRWAGFVFYWALTGERRRNRTDQPPQAAQAADQDHADDPLDDEESHETVGQLTGALFLILCLQTGLTSLSAEKRLWKLYRNLWLLSMAILHFVHHMVHGTMNRLCTHGRFGWTRHLRACLLGLFLLFAPCLFFKVSWRLNNWFNPWLISVAIFAVELAAKMLISFITYALMLVDVWRPRARMEDLLYAVKTTGAILDFLFGLCLLINGIWILLYEHGGILRTFMICIHGYFNIYQRAKKGWAQLKRRRLATRKLDSLENASSQRLQEARDEVCAICYVEFQDENGAEVHVSTGIAGWVQGEVKVTACGHLLHSACLLKWLYIRDSCPLCHQKVFNDETLASGGDTGDLDDDDLG